MLCWLKSCSLKLRSLKALPLALALVTLALVGLTLITTSCTSSNSQVRFVNAIPDETNVLDIDFNGTKAFGIDPFPSTSGSTYVSVPSGSVTVAGFVSGQTTNPVFSETSPVSFKSGSQYTVVATGTLASTVILLAPVDTNTAPANGSVNFRVINASVHGGGSVDVYILPDSAPNTTCTPQPGTGSSCLPAITALPSPESSISPTSGYVTLPYNSDGFGYTLYVAVAGQPTLVLFGYPFNVGSVSTGSIRTLVLVDNGNQTGMSQTPLVLNDLN